MSWDTVWTPPPAPAETMVFTAQETNAENQAAPEKADSNTEPSSSGDSEAGGHDDPVLGGQTERPHKKRRRSRRRPRKRPLGEGLDSATKKHVGEADDAGSPAPEANKPSQEISSAVDVFNGDVNYSDSGTRRQYLDVKLPPDTDLYCGITRPSTKGLHAAFPEYGVHRGRLFGGTLHPHQVLEHNPQICTVCMAEA